MVAGLGGINTKRVVWFIVVNQIFFRMGVQVTSQQNTPFVVRKFENKTVSVSRMGRILEPWIMVRSAVACGYRTKNLQSQFVISGKAGYMTVADR